jgi:hypothetical protein
MKNRGLLTRQGLAAIGRHKGVEAAAAPSHSPEMQATARIAAAESMQHKASAPDPQPKRRPQALAKGKAKAPSAKRYTLILKITPDLRDKLEALIGPDAPARRRLFMSAFSQSLEGATVSTDMMNPPDPAISWRLDLRLEDTFVQSICAQMGRAYEPVATVLARFIAPRLASFVEGRVSSQSAVHQHPESTLPD